MSPKDVAGVFSRPFIVGHFLLAFFVLNLVAGVNASLGLPPDLAKQKIGIQLLVIGAAALPLGLLLSTVHAHVVRLFSGEALARLIVEDRMSVPVGFRRESRDQRRWVLHRGAGWVVRKVKNRLTRWQGKRIGRHQDMWRHWHAQLAGCSWASEWERFDEEYPFESSGCCRRGWAMRCARTRPTLTRVTASTAPRCGRGSNYCFRPRSLADRRRPERGVVRLELCGLLTAGCVVVGRRGG